MREIRRMMRGEDEVVEVDMDIDPQELLCNPLLNKGSGFTRKERGELGVHGVLPWSVLTIEEQTRKFYSKFRQTSTDLDKYSLLIELQNHNETLFYRFCAEYAEEVFPYIYTPTVGEAALQFSNLRHGARGLYISYPYRDQIEEIVDNIPKERVDVIVVTDGGRVLGLGDLGVGGMAIAIGKLSFYTLFGGIHPAHTLPVALDVGTNNASLLNDPSYLGWRHRRISGKEYENFVDAFVKAITKRFPNVLIQWEDFAKLDAQSLLVRYRNRVCCFNDDIQGTASVTMAGIYAAMHGTGGALKDQRIILFGAGSAGIGIAELIKTAMQQEGVSEEEAKDRIYVLGRNGLAHTESTWLDELKRHFAQRRNKIERWDVEDLDHITLIETIKNAKPTILIGSSTQPATFNKEVVCEMKKHVARPIIFPLSNPTSKSEAIPEDLIKWSEGQALIATGSPFPPVKYGGRVFTIGQCNNVLIFPGLGLGIIAATATRVTDKMFLVAAKVLSKYAPIFDDPYASLFPGVNQLRTICRDVAINVAHEAIEQGICCTPPGNVEEKVRDLMWEPKYAEIRRGSTIHCASV